MDGLTLATICDVECLKRKIKKGDFYSAIGLSAASFHGWKNGATPSMKYIKAIEEFFDIDLSSYEDAKKIPATKEGDGQNDVQLTKEQQELIRLVPRLTEQEAAILLAQVRGILLGN